MKLVLHDYGNHECAGCGLTIYSGEHHVRDGEIRICLPCWRNQ